MRRAPAAIQRALVKLRGNDVSEYDALAVRWYVVKNDVVGGWSVATVHLPVSQLSGGARCWIADTGTRQQAERIVQLQNAALGLDDD